MRPKSEPAAFRMSELGDTKFDVAVKVEREQTPDAQGDDESIVFELENAREWKEEEDVKPIIPERENIPRAEIPLLSSQALEQTKEELGDLYYNGIARLSYIHNPCLKEPHWASFMVTMIVYTSIIGC